MEGCVKLCLGAYVRKNMNENIWGAGGEGVGKRKCLRERAAEKTGR